MKNFFDIGIDPKFTKKVTNAGTQNFISIDPYYLFEIATEQMGLLGVNWGLKDDYTFEDIHLEDGTILRRLSADFFHKVEDKVGTYPISVMDKFVYVTNSGKGYQKIDTDVDKKLVTHALSKGLSYIGFGSQIYKGLFDDDRYVAQAYQDAQIEREMELATQKQREEILFLMGETESDIKKMLSFAKIESIEDLTVPKYEVLKQALLAKKQKIEQKIAQDKAEARAKTKAKTQAKGGK